MTLDPLKSRRNKLDVRLGFDKSSPNDGLCIIKSSTGREDCTFTSVVIDGSTAPCRVGDNACMGVEEADTKEAVEQEPFSSISSSLFLFMYPKSMQSMVSSSGGDDKWES